MKSLFSRPVICLLRHTEGVILAVDKRYTKVTETGVYIKKNDSINDSLPNEFRNDTKYNIEMMLSMNKTESVHVYTKVLSSSFIPKNNTLIPHFSLDGNFNPVKYPLIGNTILDLDGLFFDKKNTTEIAKSIIRAGIFTEIVEIVKVWNDLGAGPKGCSDDDIVS